MSTADLLLLRVIFKYSNHCRKHPPSKLPILWADSFRDLAVLLSFTSSTSYFTSVVSGNWSSRKYLIQSEASSFSDHVFIDCLTSPYRPELRIKMGDRRSDSSYDGKVEDAKVTMILNAKTLNQLSSSAQAAQENRRKKALLNLGDAIQRFKDEEQGGNDGKPEEQKQSGKT